MVEKKELSEEANLLKNFVNELKEDMQNNYDSNNNLPKITIKKINSRKASNSSLISLNSNQSNLKRKRNFSKFLNIK